MWHVHHGLDEKDELRDESNEWGAVWTTKSERDARGEALQNAA